MEDERATGLSFFCRAATPAAAAARISLLLPIKRAQGYTVFDYI